ncbi:MULTISPECIES: MMPL family transporter [Serratia]|uniref:MMPL family transporter n=1 Tax=Serratia TaxID=613 RepID=UPI000C9BD59A|nr:MMPL family transporter [Serratia marcescens]EHT9935088.1 MMPL family transporter [Serratia marcescens]EIJ6675057.1 MMPL family transporter [Serratia marcescens]HED2348094.1 MMPL family transporter [Serratia marcescens]HED2395222.1 MMPL family transporter [Serratia marcescens]
MTNANTLPPTNSRRLALLWGLVCLMLLGVLLALLPGARLNSSVLAMLPKQALGSVPLAISDGFMQRLDKQVVWLVSPGKQPDPRVAETWLAQLQQSPALSEVKGKMNAESQKAWGTFFWQHRNGLIDSATRMRLQNGGEAQAQWVLSQLYSAFSGVSGKELQNDPLMLMRGSQLALAQNGQRLRLMDGWLVTQDEQQNYWYLLHGELVGDSFDMQQTHRLVAELAVQEASLKALYPQAQLLSRGTVFYSDYASQQAKRDIATLGVATILGVILLIIVVFRSLRPLLLCLLSLSVGALAGTVATLVLYGELHLMTLVMSMSIIGISADYTLYYLTERMVHGAVMSPWQSLTKVGKALLLALLTTVAAYLIMMLAPFPGIRQMAVFAAIGLSASCLTVFFWHPWLCRGLPVRPVPAMGGMLRWLAAWRRNKAVRVGVPTALALLSMAGIATLRVNDDISQLQALPPSLLAQENKISRLIGQNVDQKWFVVYGATPEQTLRRLETFLPHLERAQHEGMISHFRAIPLNSLARQEQDLRLLRDAAPTVLRALKNAGLDMAKPDLNAMPVSVPVWLESSISEGWRLLWLTLPNGQSGALVPVEGVTSGNQLGELADEQAGVAWVDRKQSFDSLFALYRSVLTGLLGIALVVIACGAMVRQGWRKGLVSLIPSVLSLGCGLAVLSFCGYSVNLFSLLALVLVLGIGINYTLFFSNPQGTPLTSLLAITLAMITTLLTLGMLLFSDTQAISCFGIVLVSGIFVAWLLSPLAMPNKKREKR